MRNERPCNNLTKSKLNIHSDYIDLDYILFNIKNYKSQIASHFF